MRGVALKTILAAVIAGSSLLVAAEANAHDRWDKWDRWERHHHKHKYKHKYKHSHWRDDDRPRRVIIERPIYVTPAPVMAAPMYMPPMGGYGPPMDPSVNFNFSFPMR